VPGGGGVGGREQTPVLRWFLNSLLAAAGQTLLILVTASMAAYALARMEFRGRKLLTVLILATLFIPPVSLLIPNYVIVAELGWLDSLTAVVVPGAADAFGVFFLASSSSRCRWSWRRRPSWTGPTGSRSSPG
jgi:multiple sugar transport system permease protein